MRVSLPLQHRLDVPGAVLAGSCLEAEGGKTSKSSKSPCLLPSPVAESASA